MFITEFRNLGKFSKFNSGYNRNYCRILVNQWFGNGKNANKKEQKNWEKGTRLSIYNDRAR